VIVVTAAVAVALSRSHPAANALPPATTVSPPPTTPATTPPQSTPVQRCFPDVESCPNGIYGPPALTAPPPPSRSPTRTTPPRPSPTQPPARKTPRPPSGRSFDDGILRVGSDIKPGTYRAPDAAGCYWARLKNFSGNFDAILANANPSGPSVVTIKPTDRGFESDDCGGWTSDLSRITASKVSFGQGTFIVGTDMVAGTYHTRGGDGCYCARLRGFTGDFDEIIANDLPTHGGYVTIRSSDAGFDSSGCGRWVKS
jgi:hypothetical protein